VEWAYTAAIIGLSLLLIRAWKGAAMGRHLAFPLWFGLAALPWPAVVQAGVIPRLRMLLAEVVADFCNLVGEPAMARGTVIQIGGANIGIEEACGGIRSLQVALIVALAAGELRRDRWRTRLGWVLAAISLSLVSNGLRLGALTWIYGKFGAATFAVWHDRLAWLEMGFIFFGLGLLYILTRPAPKPRPASGIIPFAPTTVSASAKILASALLAIVTFSEVSTWLWFQRAPTPGNPTAQWSAQLPQNSPSYADDAFTPAMQSLLGCDTHQFGHWSDPSGARRAGYVFEWNQGQGDRFELLNHNPGNCLSLSGSRLVEPRPAVSIRCGPIELPFVCSEFSDNRGIFYVYYLAWSLTAGERFGNSGEFPGSGESWIHMQWREVTARRRNIAARVVAVAIFDAANGADADQAFRAEAARILQNSRVGEPE